MSHMRLKKAPFIWLAAIIVLAVGIRAYQARISALDTDVRERYALATARLSVFDALSAHDSLETKYHIATRDSILALSEIDSAKLDDYVNSFEDHERDISQFWRSVSRLTDSLVKLELQARDTVQVDSAAVDSTAVDSTGAGE